MNRYALEFQNRYLEKQYQKRVSDSSSRLLRRILVGYFIFYVIPEISESSINQDYNSVDSNEVLSIIGYLMLSVCYIGLTKKKELYNYICLVAHIAILLTGMLGMIKHTKQKNHFMKDIAEDGKSSWLMQNIFQYSAIQVGFHFIISLISSSIKVTFASITIVYVTFILYIVILVGEGSGTSKFSIVMIIFFAFIACQMYFIHYNHRMRRQNFLHQFNDKQFTNILKNGLNQNIFFVSYNQTLNNIDIWFSNKSCEKYFSSQNKGEFKKFTRSVYLQEQVSSQSEEFYPEGNGILSGKPKKEDRSSNNQYGNITDELSLEQKKKSLQASSKDKNAKLENVIIELIKAQIKKQKHKNYYDFSQFKKYLAIQREDVAATPTVKNGNNQNGQQKQEPVKEKLFQFKINTFIRNSCFNSCIIFNEEEWDKYNGLYKDKCSLQLQKQQDFIQMLQPVIQKMEPFTYLHETLVACVNQSATLLNNMLLYNLIIQNKYDNRLIISPDYMCDFSLPNLLEYIRVSNSIFFPIKYDFINGSTSADNIIIHSNQKRVAQILQNFILEIGKFVNQHRKNSTIDSININAQQIKGVNSQSNIIKFIISFNVSDNSSHNNRQSILMEENEEEDDEDDLLNRNSKKKNTIASEYNNQQQGKGDLDEDNQREFSDEEGQQTNSNLKRNSNELSDEIYGAFQQYKYCKQGNNQNNIERQQLKDDQITSIQSNHVKNNLSLQYPQRQNNNLFNQPKKKRSLPQIYQNNNSQINQSKEALLNQNDNSEVNLLDQNNAINVINQQNQQSKDNQASRGEITSENLRLAQTPSTISFQNMTIQQVYSSDILKQKQVKIQQTGYEGIATSIASDNNTIPTNKQPSINSNTVLVGNISNYATTSPSNLFSTSFRDTKQYHQQQQLQSIFRDQKTFQKNEDIIDIGPLMKFDDQVDNEQDRQEDYQSITVREDIKGTKNQNLQQDLLNYQFQNQIKQKNNQFTINLINPDFKLEAQNDQIQKVQNINKQARIQQKQQMHDSSYNPDSSKGINVSNLIPAQNIAEDQFSFQSPSNNIISSIKNLDNNGQLLTHANTEAQKSSLFSTQSQQNGNVAPQPKINRNGVETMQVISQHKEIASIDSPFKYKADNQNKDDNLILFRDEEDSKNSSNDQNKNAVDCNDSYSMKKRHTSHFAAAAIPTQSATTEVNTKTNLNTTQNNYNNKTEDIQDDKQMLNNILDQSKDIINNSNYNPHSTKKNKSIKSPETNNIKISTSQSKQTPQDQQQMLINNKGGSLENQKLINLTKTPQSMAMSSINQSLSPNQLKEHTKISQVLNQQSNHFTLDNSQIVGQQNKNQLKNNLQQSTNLKTSNYRKPNKHLTSNPTLQQSKVQYSPLMNNQQFQNQQIQSNGGMMNSVQLPNVANQAQSSNLNPLNIKQAYQETLKIIKTFKPDQDLVYQRLNCLNLQVNAKLICALGPTNDILVNEKNEFCFYLYQDMRILHSTEQQFQNNYNSSLVQFNDNYGPEQQSLTKFAAQNKSQLNFSLQKDMKAEYDNKQSLSESQLSNLLTSNHQGETCANRIDQSSFSPGKIFRTMKTIGSNPQF